MLNIIKVGPEIALALFCLDARRYLTWSEIVFLGFRYNFSPPILRDGGGTA
jgi:hypothetical protein